MTEPTNQPSFRGTATSSEKPMEEGQLCLQTAQALFISAFIMALVGAIGYGVCSGLHTSVGSTLAMGLSGAICALLGLAVPLIGAWGGAVVIGCRLNWLFDKPLNPSAIAALAANFAFLVAAMLATGVACNQPMILLNSALGIIFLFSGSLLFQFTARIAITRQILRHNALAGHKLYIEPPCQFRFRIRQLMILTLVFAIGLALIQQSPVRAVLPKLLQLMGISMAILATVFYPAFVASARFSKKFSKVRLKPWERRKPEPWERRKPEDKKLEALMIPIPKYQAKATGYDKYRTAGNWLNCSGGIFALGLLVISQISRTIHHDADFIFLELIFAIPLGGYGFVFTWILSSIILRILWAFFEHLCRPGTLVAIAGGFIGALGTFIVLGICELLHFDHRGFFSLDANNLFPLAMVLFGSLVGQAMGRMGIKVHGFRAGVSAAEYQALATDSLRIRSTWIKPLLLSASCWCIFLALNGATDQSIQNSLLEMLTGMIGCMFTVWPLANMLVRAARVAPKHQAIPQPASPQLVPMPTSSREKSLQT